MEKLECVSLPVPFAMLFCLLAVMKYISVPKCVFQRNLEMTFATESNMISNKTNSMNDTELRVHDV